MAFELSCAARNTTEGSVSVAKRYVAKSSNVVSPSHPTLSKSPPLLLTRRVDYGHDPQYQLPSS